MREPETFEITIGQLNLILSIIDRDFEHSSKEGADLLDFNHYSYCINRALLYKRLTDLSWSES